MEIHHAKHHATYVKNFNATLEQVEAAQARGDVAALIALQAALKFNGGGHVNHSLFWENMAPASAGGFWPNGALADALVADFGSFAAFQAAFAAAAAGVQGSGWAWLVFNSATRRLEVTTRANQDPVSTNAAHVPLLGIDVWEHAYYLQYKNVRPDWIEAFWDVVAWPKVAERYAAATKK